MYLESVKALKAKLIMSDGGFTYVAELKGSRVDRKMDHLVCFVGGLLALGAQVTRRHCHHHAILHLHLHLQLTSSTLHPQHLPEHRDEHMDLAAKITETCYRMYSGQKTGLAPEFVRFSSSGMAVVAGHNLLRPEAVEAIYYMWRFTKDPKYREWGWRIFLAFEEHCKVATGGYAGLKNVNSAGGAKDDTMQTFWLAETLKYLLLLFSDDDALDLDKFTINTEAHPMRNLPE